MNCKCFDQMNELTRPENTQLAWMCLFNRETGATRYVPKLEVMKADPKDRRRPKSIIPSFCPFCGKAYEAEGKEASQ